MRFGRACVLAGGAMLASWGARAADLVEEGDRRASAGDSSGAARAYERAVAHDPGNLDAHDKLATHRIALGLLEEVIAQLEPVVAANPTRVRALYSLAYCYRKTARSSEAVRTYAAYLQLRPGDPDPYYGYALALRDLGDADGALRTLRKYVSMERRPEEAAWVTKAEALIREIEAGAVAAKPKGGGDADIEFLRTRVRDRPEDIAAWEELARVLQSVGRSREAGAAMRRVERLKSGEGTVPARQHGQGRSALMAGAPSGSEIDDALLPLQGARAGDEDKRRSDDEARQARAESRREKADEMMLRAERRRLARAEARGLREEKAAQEKAERDQAIAERRARREAARTERQSRRDERQASAEERGATPEDRGSGEIEGASAVPDAAPASGPPTPAIPPDLGPQDIERLRTAVRDHPEDGRNWFLLAAALRSGGRAAEAALAERRYARLRAGAPPP